MNTHTAITKAPASHRDHEMGTQAIFRANPNPMSRFPGDHSNKRDFGARADILQAVSHTKHEMSGQALASGAMGL